MKILFLDIDGVLNSFDGIYCRTALWKQDKTPSRDEFGQLFDERCVRWLKWIIVMTECKIVISSTWRHSGLDEMKNMWKTRNLPGEVIDCTPNMVSDEILHRYSATNNLADRGYEIQEWIDKYKPEKYCIVDDDNDMLSHQTFVQTKGRIGLDVDSANAIVAKLNSI